mmetsp:Transcript_6038/g.9569  ORF Transcript_6038/g.9569 Transcript_6038/m.9569 type:complete len:1430 (+) Transcript_6038:180-4469(+)
MEQSKSLDSLDEYMENVTSLDSKDQPPPDTIEFSNNMGHVAGSSALTDEIHNESQKQQISDSGTKSYNESEYVVPRTARADDILIEATENSESSHVDILHCRQFNEINHIPIDSAHEMQNESQKQEITDTVDNMAISQLVRADSNLLNVMNTRENANPSASATYHRQNFHLNATEDPQYNNAESPIVSPLLQHTQNMEISHATGQDIIELLDDEKNDGSCTLDTSNSDLKVNKRKRPMSPTIHSTQMQHAVDPAARSVGQASAQSRTQNMPNWMNEPYSHLNFQNHSISQSVARMPQHNISLSNSSSISPFLEPIYIPMRSSHVPTWAKLLPQGFLASRKANEEQAVRRKRYELSLLNVSEFTVTGASPDGILDPTSVRGLRSYIRQISREYGKAVFEHDSESEDGGKWRIPLGAYQTFFTYLRSLPNTVVHGIPTSHLNIAMLAQQRKEKGYPSINKLIHIGVPEKIAKTLAPFQRGGVEFIYERNGRALLADEMGLGKTIQGIASMAIYHEDWPILVLSPSSARYHWQNEFLNWLGDNEEGNQVPEFGNDEEADTNNDTEGHHASSSREEIIGDSNPTMQPLLASQIHVLTAGSDAILPSPDTKVVIISYGLAPKLVQDGKITLGMFQCAVVDESHMLKNRNSQRTKCLLPVLKAARRCVLLSGTPAFARPIELWPQMSILGTENDEWLTSEAEFVQKYVKSGGKHARAELHTLLTGTIMIRRMKADILKQMPSKRREQALVKVTDKDTGQEFARLIELLKQGKGALGKIAKKHAMSDDGEHSTNSFQHAEKHQDPKKIVQEEVQALFDTRNAEIESFYNAQQVNQQIAPSHVQNFKIQALNALRVELDQYYHHRLGILRKENARLGEAAQPGGSDEPQSRKAVLIKLYKKTGQAKVPFVVEMLKLWINNPAKGKLCIFAHHVSVLNEIHKLSGLSNAADTSAKFIRIDGATNPKQRQELINAFQNDPLVRIALLGITAAGVAVTLTAASTVWFAELFWTPALLIQAEDRVHRIGQQAQVRCMYIVAKGTLDEILWKHVEKKFRDLGEFVEGREKMKIVVHKMYHGASEFRKSLEVEKLDLEDDNIADNDAMESADELEEELHHDFEELEREEQAMINSEDADEDLDGEGGAKTPAAKICTPTNGKTVAGSTESEAICLSDDDEPVLLQKSLQEEGIHRGRSFPELKLYKMRFYAPSCGFQFIVFKGRVIVLSKDKNNRRLKPGGKPSVGDIILAVKNQEIITRNGLDVFTSHLMNLMRADGYLDFIFAEDKEFAEYFREQINSLKQKKGKKRLFQILPTLQTYTLTFEGDADYGFGIESLCEAIIVTEINPSRLKAIGSQGTLKIPDILISINKRRLHQGERVGDIESALEEFKAKGEPVEMTFAAADQNAKSLIMQEKQKMLARDQPPVRPPQRSVNPDVIDLID